MYSINNHMCGQFKNNKEGGITRIIIYTQQLVIIYTHTDIVLVATANSFIGSTDY